jgi:NADPH:quinone reductase-like Zn-dependent oxidoreductase
MISSFHESSGAVAAGLTALESIDKIKPYLNKDKQQSALIVGASGGVGTILVQLARLVYFQI